MKKIKKIISVILSVILIVSTYSFLAGAVSGSGEFYVSKLWDEPTNTKLQSLYDTSVTTGNNGRIWVDKSVSGNSLTFKDSSGNNIVSDMLSVDESGNDFLVALSSNSQRYKTSDAVMSPYKHINIVIVQDSSSSMSDNTVDNGQTRLALLKKVAKGFVDTAVSQAETGIDINLSIVSFSGSATTVLDWTSLSSATKPTVYSVIDNRLVSRYNKSDSNTNIQSGIVMGNYMFEKSTNGGADGKCTSTPDSVNNPHTSNYMLLITDGGPNRYYNDTSYGISSNVAINNVTFPYAMTNTSNISHSVTATDYKKLSAKYAIDAAGVTSSINNISMYTAGIGEWFTSDAEDSGFSTAPYLLQLISAVGNNNVAVEDVYKYLGEDIPNYTMPNNNPTFPELKYQNYYHNTGGSNKMAIQTGGNSWKYYDTTDELKVGADSIFGNYEYRCTLGINEVGYDVLHLADNYFAGNTANTFEQSIINLSNTIQNHIECTLTESGDPNTDGFIAFKDELGECVHVNDFRAIYYKGTLYTGASFAEKATGSIDITSSDFEMFYDSLGNSLRAPYMSMEKAQSILSSNINAGEIYYNSDSDYSNKIKWYAAYDEVNNVYYYVGNYFNEDGTVADPPIDATSIRESWFIDHAITLTTGEGKTFNTNLMYANIGIATDMSTDMQTVGLAIPTALEPESNVLVDDNGIAYVEEESLPISLIYSVCPLHTNVDSDYHFLDKTLGTVSHYTNNWNVNYTDTDNTYSLYTPDKRNTFYYLQEDEILYSYNSADSAYVPATEDNSASGLYYREYENTDTGEKITYYTIDEYFVNHTVYTGEDGYVYLKAGAFRTHDELQRVVYKTENTSQSSPYENYSTAAKLKASSKTYTAYIFLGNNGVIKRESVGIELTKVWNDSNNLYGTRPDSILVTIDSEGEKYCQTEIKQTDCVVSVNDDNNTVWLYTIYGLPSGSTYTIHENDTPFYTEPYEINGDHEVTITNSSETWFLNGTKTVLDFGLPINIDFFEKCGKSEYKNYSNMEIAVADDNSCSKGTAETDGLFVVYTPATMLWDDCDTVKITMNCNGASVSSFINIVPAANMYFEENFITFDSEWADTGHAPDLIQSDENKVYGYDAAYSANSNVLDSSGCSKTATVSTADTMSDASFSFKGTGFDLISRTGTDTGTIFLQVRNTATNKVIKTYIVDTYLEKETLYQIPVIHCTDLEYGTYNVTIKAYYDKIFDHHYKTELEGSYNVYIDAVRIYYPVGSDVDSYSSIVADSYNEAGELGSTYRQLRTSLIDAETWNHSETDIVNGAVYIADGTTAGKNDEWTSDGVYLSNGGNTYKSKGPKNEVYLTDGNGIAFHVNSGSFVHISAKSPNGSPVYLSVYNTNQKAWYRLAQITSATEMFYDVSEYVHNGDVILKCTSDEPSAILALCQIKTVPPATISDEPVVSENLIASAYKAYGTQNVIDTTHTCVYHRTETVKAASCTENGVIRYYCECGKYYDEQTDMLPHTYVNGVCSVCDAVDESYVAPTVLDEKETENGETVNTEDNNESKIAGIVRRISEFFKILMNYLSALFSFSA